MDLDRIKKWEMKLEDFLCDHLDLISPEARMIRRQYVLNDPRKRQIGIIDIFAQREDGTRLLIELKCSKLIARDLGQCIGYWGYWNQRSEKLKLPPPVVYCIGPSVDPIYEYGAKALSNLPIINTMTYEFPLGYGPEDEKWNVNLIPFDDDHRRFKVPLR